MIVKSLELCHFRNYDELKLDFEEGTNILYGSNAQGKTNILEAIYLSGTTKSHRGSKDKDMIQFGFQESHIRIFTEKQEKKFQIVLPVYLNHKPELFFLFLRKFFHVFRLRFHLTDRQIPCVFL